MRFFVRTAERETHERLRLRDAVSAAVEAARRGGIAIVGDGDPRGDDDLLDAHEYWRRKYGDEEWSLLRADDVYRLLEEVTKPAELDLTPIRRGSFACRAVPDIIRVLRFTAAKGASYVIQWGVSLAFVPHEFERRIRFHRTLKSADLDLFECTPEEFVRRGLNEREGFVAAGYGERVFRRDAAAAWELARPRAMEWWASTRSVEGVLAAAREQTAVLRGPRHWPDPAMVAAFGLARVGRGDEARRALDGWLETRASVSETAAENLVRALERVQPR